MNKIYTKFGDSGITQLLSGEEVSKSDIRIDLIGEIDELSATIGVAVSNISTDYAKIKEYLITIQKNLFKLSSYITFDEELQNRKKKFWLTENSLGEIESLIDEMEETLPVLTNFILPGGSVTSSLLHKCRVVCRRVERRAVKYYNFSKHSVHESDLPAIESIATDLAYMNRLSDFLFVAARYVNFKEGIDEILL